MLYICEHCGEEYSQSPAQYKAANKHYCSKKCRGRAQRRGIVVQCSVCGKDIERAEWQLKRNKSHYCSKECSNIGKIKHLIVACDNCGVEFEAHPSRFNRTNHHFCSNSCCAEFRLEHQEEMYGNYTGRIELECSYCGKLFIRKPCAVSGDNQYCSIECQHKSLIKAEIVVCDYCGKEFAKKKSQIKLSKSNYCNRQCKGKAHAQENHSNWRGGSSRRGYGNEFGKKLKKTIRLRDSYTCQECGLTEQETGRKHAVHHIDYDKLNNDPDNLISLCRECHGYTNFNREDWEKRYKLKRHSYQEVD